MKLNLSNLFLEHQTEHPLSSCEITSSQSFYLEHQTKHHFPHFLHQPRKENDISDNQRKKKEKCESDEQERSEEKQVTVPGLRVRRVWQEFPKIKLEVSQENRTSGVLSE